MVVQQTKISHWEVLYQIFSKNRLFTYIKRCLMPMRFFLWRLTPHKCSDSNLGNVCLFLLFILIKNSTALQPTNTSWILTPSVILCDNSYDSSLLCKHYLRYQNSLTHYFHDNPKKTRLTTLVQHLLCEKQFHKISVNKVPKIFRLASLINYSGEKTGD